MKGLRRGLAALLTMCMCLLLSACQDAARERNAGWRIDYFVVSESLKDAIVSTEIHNEIYGSDHCPVELIINLKP